MRGSHPEVNRRFPGATTGNELQRLIVLASFVLTEGVCCFSKHQTDNQLYINQDGVRRPVLAIQSNHTADGAAFFNA